MQRPSSSGFGRKATRTLSDKFKLTNSQVQRSGYTLIETLAVVFIIAVICALIIPAVQLSREASRRSQCSNNLRQIGIALHSYTATTGVFPPGANGNRAFSAHAMILPYLEEVNLFNSVNFHIRTPWFGPDRKVNETAYSVSLEVYVCPSDSMNHNHQVATTNYAGNGGSGYQKYGNNGLFAAGNAPTVSPASVTDGLSTTAAISEILTGATGEIDDRRRLIFQTPSTLANIDQFDKFKLACESLSVHEVNIPYSNRGVNWWHGEFGITLYNHVLLINKNTCTNNGLVREGAWSVSSNHSGKINMLYADGHVGNLSSSINEAIWYGLASRNGGEIIENFP